jgi:hypothetical protein
MKISRLLLLTAALAGFVSFALAAADKPAAGTATKDKPDATWLAKAKAAYPLKTCVVADEELGGMGDAVDYVHKEAGKPDRLVRFCCSMCVPKFKKDPAKYLAKIDAAAAAKAKS